MKKYAIILGISTVMALSACGESTIERVDSEETETVAADVENGEKGTDVEAEIEDEEVAEEDLRIGDTMNVNGLYVTVKGVRTDTGKDEWDTPEKDFYLILDVELENTTEESQNISTLLQMSLQDDASYSQDISIFADTKGSLDGEIGAGRKLAGEIAFDVEESDFYEFLFEDPFMSGQAIWTIDRGEVE